MKMVKMHTDISGFNLMREGQPFTAWLEKGYEQDFQDIEILVPASDIGEYDNETETYQIR